MGGFAKAFGRIGKVISKVDPLRGGDKIAEAIGLPTVTGQGDRNIFDMGATEAARQADEARKAQEAAAAEQARIAQQTLAQQQQLQEINKNYATDLSTDNRARVEAGGSAAALDAATNDLKKKQGVGLASTLGINV